jgi:hypothetical protein
MHFLIFFCSNPATFIEELDLHTVNLDSHITYHTINTLHRTCPDTYNKGTVWHVWHKPLPWNMLWHIIERYNIWHVWPKPLPWNMLWHIIERYSMTCLTQTLAMKYVVTHNRKVQYMTCLTQTLAMKYVVTHNRKVQYDMSDPNPCHEIQSNLS